MEQFLLFIDRLSAGVGKAFGWCIVIMTLGTCYDVFMRYLFSAPTNWAFDVSYFMYGALFMMAGAYTLSRNGHVRGDVVYRLLPYRWQAGVDLVLYNCAARLRHSVRQHLVANSRSEHLRAHRRASLSA